MDEVPDRLVVTRKPMEPTAPIEELKSLRLAAARGDWNGCQDATEQLLLRLPTLRALMLARDFLACRLPIFERHQPGVRWPRELIESVPAPATLHDKRRWPQNDDFSGPGANNFISAVETLWTADPHKNDRQQWSSALAAAIAGAVMAERNEFWGSHHPDAWARWYQSDPDRSDDPSRFAILIALAKDPAVMKVERTAWLEVADRLEAALREE